MIRRNIIIGASIAALACGGADKETVFVPHKEDYACISTPLSLPISTHFARDRQNYDLPKRRSNMFITDDDCNGIADRVHWGGFNYFVRVPREGPLGPLAKDTTQNMDIPMTDEMEELASNMLREHKRMTYLVDSLLLAREAREYASDSVRKARNKLEKVQLN